MSLPFELIPIWCKQKSAQEWIRFRATNFALLLSHFIPVIDATMDLQPLRSHAISVESLFQIVDVFLSCFPEFFTEEVAAAIFQWWGLIHVVLTNVEAE